jgi:hypothetical protein
VVSGGNSVVGEGCCDCDDDVGRVVVVDSVATAKAASVVVVASADAVVTGMMVDTGAAGVVSPALATSVRVGSRVTAAATPHISRSAAHPASQRVTTS